MSVGVLSFKIIHLYSFNFSFKENLDNGSQNRALHFGNGPDFERDFEL